MAAALVAAAAFFIALAIAGAGDNPRTCPPVKRGRQVHGSIQSHDVGRGLTCREVRHVIVLWVDRRFPARVGPWRFRSSGDCSCQIAERRLPGGRRQRFIFS